MSPELKEKVLATIKRHVAENAIPRVELARITGLTPSQLSKILNDKIRMPHAATLRTMGEALFGSMDGLLAKNEAAPGPVVTTPREHQRKTRSPASVLAVFRELSSVVDQLLEGAVVTPVLEGRLTPIVKAFRTVVNAEAVALFELRHDSPNELILVASESDRLEVDAQLGIHLKIRSASAGGLTGNIVKAWKANKPAIVNLGVNVLDGNPYVAETYQNHLVGGLGYSTLLVPLKDRHGRLTGLIAVANKKTPEGVVDEKNGFTQEDEQISEFLADKIVRVLELSTCLKLFHTSLVELQEGADVCTIRSRLLQGIVDLMRADEGELAVWDSAKQNLVFDAIVSYKEGPLPLGFQPVEVNDAVPQNHPLRHAWLNPKEKSILGKGQLSRSSLAIGLTCNGRRLGALNIEAAAFEEEDAVVLNVLGKWAGIILQTADGEARMSTLLQTVLNRPSKLQENLQDILQAIHVIYGVKSGAIYVAGGAGRELKCAAHYEGAPLEHLPEEPLKIEDKGRSQVMRLFLDKKQTCYYSAQPKDEREPYVPKAELEQFKFEGSFLAIPLEFEKKRVGVLAAWSKETPEKGSQNPLKKAHRMRLQGLAALAAWSIISAGKVSKKPKRPAPSHP